MVISRTHHYVFGLPLKEMTPAAFKKTLGRHAFAGSPSRFGSAFIPPSLIGHDGE